MILRTEAVVLRAIDYGETSQIVTLFTRDRGKIAVLARGSRLPKSRFGSTLQPGSYTQVIFYYKAGRALQTITESAHVQLFHATAQDLEKLTVAFRIIELVNVLMQEEQQNALVFNLLVLVLQRLNEAGARVSNLLPYFQLRLASLLGFAPAIDRETLRQLPEEGGLLLLDSGTVMSEGNGPGALRKASRGSLRAFAICARADLDMVMNMHLRPEIRIELDTLVEDFLRHHLEEHYPSRSAKVIHQIAG
jgi:DNA repair protein RecO (recombination protein O)